MRRIVSKDVYGGLFHKTTRLSSNLCFLVTGAYMGPNGDTPPYTMTWYGNAITGTSRWRNAKRHICMIRCCGTYSMWQCATIICRRPFSGKRRMRGKRKSPSFAIRSFRALRCMLRMMKRRGRCSFGRFRPRLTARWFSVSSTAASLCFN